MNPVLLVVVATGLALGPVVAWEYVSNRVEFVAGRTYTIGLMAVLFATAVAVLVAVPSAPAVRLSTPDGMDLLLVLAASPLMWGSAIVVGILTKAIGISLTAADVDPFDTDSGESEGDVEPDEARTGDDSTDLLPAMGTMALAGPGEEPLFRGVIQTWLVGAFGSLPGILGASTLFGLYHYPNSVDSLGEIDTEAMKEMSISGLGGAVLGVLYFLSGNLLVPILGHALHNAGLAVVLHRRSDDGSGSAPAATANARRGDYR